MITLKAGLIVARPTKYKEEYANIAKSMCKLGATDFDICEALQINRATFYRWKLEHKELCDALKMGKTAIDDKVERSLFERAVGYSHEDTDIRVVEGEIVQTPTVKHYPPDPTSMIYWLKNRRPDKWRQNPEEGKQESTKPVNITFRLPTEEEVKNSKSDD